MPSSQGGGTLPPRVANILVYIELSGDRPSDASLEALGEARRIASFLGATLYAVVACASPPRYASDDAIAVLGRHGADKIVLCGGPDASTPPTYLTHGSSLAAALERVPAALIVMAATPGGRDLAPRVAARLGGAFVPEPTIEYGGASELVLSRAVYGRRYDRRLSAMDVERPIVTTLTPGWYPPAAGDDEVDVILLGGGAPRVPGYEVARERDPGAALDTARVVVTAGAGVSVAEYALVRELAEALGGEIAVTREAVRRGLGSPEREVGVGARRVSPRLYVACGASGSAEHLGAVSPGARIVAINRDPAAPIFRLAAYGLVGDVGAIAPEMAAAARAGRS